MNGIPEYSSLQSHADYRLDSQIYNSKLSIYNDENPEIARMEREAFNYIQQSGAITYIYLRTEDLGKVDPVWEEDADPTYYSAVSVKGQFVPEKMSTALKKWGVDSDTKFEVNYSRAQLLSLFGDRLIRMGDVIQIPHNTLVQTQNTEFIDGQMGLADKFRIIDARDSGNFNYRWLYWTCTVELLTGDITVRPRSNG